ncbi:MAG: hypothetical protein L6R39_006755 [Caloplaca ligustica]|nr:MAG: hypothetical protein L6R39_006755 [Caloplaca ligustica]
MPGSGAVHIMPSLISLPPDYGETVPSRGRSSSPIRSGPSVEQLRRPPSRTFIPLATPVDIIDFPQIPHPRITVAIHVSAPLFMGGATVEGAITLTIDDGPKTPRAARRLTTMSIDRITVGLVGIERSGARQHMFTCLMTDLIDEAHPPPVEMARPDQPVSDRLWEVMPSKNLFPFRLDLPVTLGPPPFKSKKNGISYLISVLVEAKVDGRRVYVRKSEEVVVLTVHDPAEKALVNLPNPLVVTDEVQSSHRGSLETVILTAGVHRQTWISGYPLFVDVRIQNRGSKAVRKVGLQLEKSTFVFAHAAPSADTGLGDTLRLPDRCDKEVIYKAICPGWQVAGQSYDLKTCSLFIPSGLVSVDAGRFFGVRFFLNIRITVSYAYAMLLHDVQSSIDVPPNCLAQVAATIEYKHRHRASNSSDPSYRYHAGQAFVAARRQSFEHVARKTMSSDEMTNLANLLGDPHKPSTQQQPRRRASTSHVSSAASANANASVHPKVRYRSSRFLEGSEGFRNPPASPQRPLLGSPLLADDDIPPRRQPPAIPKRRTHTRHRSLEEQPSRQRLLDSQAPSAGQQGRTRSSLEERGVRGPRLQRSTSGLKFSSSEDDGTDVAGRSGVQARGL